MQGLSSYFPDLALMEHQNEAVTSRYSLIDDFTLQIKNASVLCIVFA